MSIIIFTVYTMVALARHGLFLRAHSSGLSKRRAWGQCLISCAANLVLQGDVKSADGKAVLAFDFSVVSAAVRCTVGSLQWMRRRSCQRNSWATKARRPIICFECSYNFFSESFGWKHLSSC